MIFPKGAKTTSSKADEYDNSYYGGGSDDYGYENEPQKETAQNDNYDRGSARRAAPSFSDNGAAYSMKLMKPSSYPEGTLIADQLLKNNAVIINLENADNETASNLIFFLHGVIYAIDGHLKPVSSDTYMLTPHNMEIAEEGLGASEQTSGSGDIRTDGQGYGGYGGYRN